MTTLPTDFTPPVGLEVHRFADRAVWWSRRHGRGFVTGTDAAWKEAWSVRVRRWGDPDPLRACWALTWSVILVPGGLWGPAPLRPGPGGHAYRLVSLDPGECRLLSEVDGRRSGADLADASGLDDRSVRALATKLTAFDVQALQLRERPPRPGDASLKLVLGPARPPNVRTEDQLDDRGHTTLTHWHQHAIVDGSTHFDDRETTFAHAFGEPHPALGGSRYGARLREVLRERGWAVDGPVLEVGCGTGELAAGWGEPTRGSYRRIDLSPELLRTQQLAAPWSEGEEGDLADLPVETGSVPLLLSNEVLADLRAAPVGDPQTEARREALGLPALDAGFYNPGSWSAIQEAARVLAPDGRALFTEFGVLEGAVEEAVQLDHPEVAIQFGHLARLARSLGLEVELVRLDDLIRPDPAARWLSRISWRAVRSWAASEGTRLPARAWTPASLADRLPGPCSGLHWVPLDEEGPGPLPARFWALLLHRPA